MIDSSDVPLIVSFCAALAGAGAFGIQARRIWLERARLVVTSAVKAEKEILVVRLLNVGTRPGFDVEVSCSRLRPDFFAEGIEAGGERDISLTIGELPAELIVSYGDPHSGRVTELRQLTLAGHRIVVGLRQRTQAQHAADRHLFASPDVEDSGRAVPNALTI